MEDAEREHGTGLGHWLRRLPPVEQDMEAEERAAIEAEARGGFGPPKPAAEHAAEVAALMRGYETHITIRQMISDKPARASPRCMR